MRRTEARQGITLIELLIALAIGSFLILGAVNVFSSSRKAYRAQELILELQQNARFALAAIESDVRMAGYFGLTTRPGAIAGRAGPSDPRSALAPGNDCGRNWAVHLDQPIAATNNVWQWDCAPRGRSAAGADTLVVRRVAAEPEFAPLDSATRYIRSNRTGQGTLFVGSNPPSGPDTASETHRLAVSGYYVSENSVLDSAAGNVPSLRRKLLRRARIVDEEVMPFVEDLQVRFLVTVSTSDADGAGVESLLIDPDPPIIDPGAAQYDPAARITAVRIWLRLRARLPEPGFIDTRAYAYADRTYFPDATERSYRRLVVSKTLQLRNARRVSGSAGGVD